MKRTVNTGEFENLNSNELLDLVSTDFHSATRETLDTVDVQLQTAHKCDPKDEELEYAWTVIKTMRGKFEEHVRKEERLLFPLLTVSKRKSINSNEAREVVDFIGELKEEHQEIKNQFVLLRKATHEYECAVDSFPSQKLAYAQLNNLEQDFNRIFFVEEEYVFPRLLRFYNK